MNSSLRQQRSTLARCGSTAEKWHSSENYPRSSKMLLPLSRIVVLLVAVIAVTSKVESTSTRFAGKLAQPEDW